jgi:hypothetical protein
MKPFGFSDDASLGRELGALLTYWQGLKRGQADIPFADDVRLTTTARPESAMLLDVIQKPVRFRFAIVGQEIRDRYGEDLAGLQADDLTVRPPLDFLLSQCSATVEGRAPTYYAGKDYARLLLPLWGEGHIHMLLGGVAALKKK